MNALLAQMVSLTEAFVVVGYLLVIVFLGWLGFRHTRTATDYLIAGRKTHPFIMAMSYGSTFISTSAIVGFGGVAAMFGMSILWLVFLNIFVGIFIAFVFLGEPTRKLGHRLDAHTFPELLGRRYRSKFIQLFAGLIISIFIPLYASAVLIGGCEFIAAQFHISYNVALIIFSVLIAAYVVVGGLKGVMYTDALQGSIMFLSMLLLLSWTYSKLGGITDAHESLAAMGDQAFVGFKAIGHQGWTAFPEFGWGDDKYNLWWLTTSTIILGVGIGVLAQPQLVVRFMTVKSIRQLNRAVLIGGLFILVIPGTAYIVGSLSNVYFSQMETITGRLISIDENVPVIAKKARDVEKTIPCNILHLDTDEDGISDIHLIAEGVGKATEIMPKAEILELGDGMVEVSPRSPSFTRAVVPIGENRWMFNSDSIVPVFITSALPKWFGTLFLLTLLSAAMSTLSSQFHALGTSIGRDVYERVTDNHDKTIGVTRVAIVVGILIAMTISHYARGGYIIARATAIFFGLCASAFLPAFIGGLFFKRMTRAGAIASMAVGFVVTAFWLLFVKASEAGPLGLVQKVTDGHTSLLWRYPNWPTVDPLVIALPLSILTAIIVSLMTRPMDEEHLRMCFPDKG